PFLPLDLSFFSLASTASAYSPILSLHYALPISLNRSLTATGVNPCSAAVRDGANDVCAAHDCRYGTAGARSSPADTPSARARCWPEAASPHVEPPRRPCGTVAYAVRDGAGCGCGGWPCVPSEARPTPPGGWPATGTGAPRTAGAAGTAAVRSSARSAGIG